MRLWIHDPLAIFAEGAERGRRRIRSRVESPDFTRRKDEIGLLSGALRGMTDALYSRIEAIESFAADVSHELRNPLTSLPGNVPINDTINRLLAEDVVFVVAYVDLDYFKPFNDAYGYARGDQLLLHVAELLRENISPRTDFVGHLGGDDFVMILRSPDWAERLRRVVSEFARGVAGFYSAEHRRTGGIETADRYGELRRFGFLTMSVAILDTGAERFVSAGEMAERLQAVKARAKAVPGNCLLYSTPQGVLELLSQTALPGADGMMVANL